MRSFLSVCTWHSALTDSRGMLQGYVFQMLAAKLGVATGKHLAQHCRQVSSECCLPICSL